MPRNIPNKAKLTAFRPVRVPKVKDIFKRIGYRNLPNSQEGMTADFSRNPLEHFDSESRKFDEYAYQQYAEQMKREAESSDNQNLEDKKSEMEE